MDSISEIIRKYSLENIEELTQFEREMEMLKSLNGYLRDVYENYTDDTICITDENGIVEYCGEACERHCGLTAKEIIGMDLHDVEKDGYFTPSATVKTIQTHKTEAVIQETKIGRMLITIGIPVFEDGKLSKVISISRDFSKEIDIAKLLIKSRYGYSLDEDNEETGVKNDIASDQIVTCSSELYSIISLLRVVAQTDTTILFTGATGTGKTLFAEFVHKNSKRADKPYIHVNCGSMVETILESELYGYEAGSFTGSNREGKKGLFEMANGGTIFLDEIGDMSLPQQVKLLHAIQERKIRRVGGNEEIELDIRILVATNRDLKKLVAEGKFREDLYYRLKVVTIELPRLRNHIEDVPLLVRHFLDRYNAANNTNKEISDRALEVLCAYSWPGNTRELENTVEMLAVTTFGNVIELHDLPEEIRKQMPETEAVEDDKSVEVRSIGPLQDLMEETEEIAIRKALEQGGSPKEAARLLGVDRTTVTRKMDKYGITKKK
ncbi:MAG: sigma 54-interacting transcriptional regulator [Firmicutes bacterium]|nr:sigma 54-interacting transcriptional regulator [Bacillota bacterium]